RARGALRQQVADHGKGQELVALHAQDRPQTLDIVGAEQAVAALGAAGRDQLLILEKPDLRDRDVVELLAQHPADGADGQIRGRGVGLGGHQRSMKVRRYLPTWSSSPSESRASSTRSRLT